MENSWQGKVGTSPWPASTLTCWRKILCYWFKKTVSYILRVGCAHWKGWVSLGPQDSNDNIQKEIGKEDEYLIQMIIINITPSPPRVLLGWMSREPRACVSRLLSVWAAKYQDSSACSLWEQSDAAVHASWECLASFLQLNPREVTPWQQGRYQRGCGMWVPLGCGCH